MNQALYALQARALDDPTAAEECARRYAAAQTAAYSVSPYSPVKQKRIAAAYLMGLRGEPQRAWNNYDRPLRNAWYAGRDLRNQVTTEKAKPDSLVNRLIKEGG